jgi:heat shock protein HslJ
MNVRKTSSESRWPVLLLACMLSTQALCADQHQISITDLQNSSYTGIEAVPVRLKDGHWQGQPYVENGASRPTVGLLKEFYLNGDLDGDDIDETIAILWQNSGGTGSDIHIAVMQKHDDAVKNIATALVGDRVKLRDGRIESGRIFLDVLQSGEDDAMCCPTQLATRSWSMLNGHLQEGEIEMTGKLSLDTLNGTEWVLTHMNRQQPLGDNIEITLAFSEDRLTGKSACNRYSAGIEQGDTAGNINIGQAMGTRMACPEALMKAEQQYLEALSKVSSFSFHAGRLALNGQNVDGAAFQMLFMPSEPEHK